MNKRITYVKETIKHGTDCQLNTILLDKETFFTPYTIFNEDQLVQKLKWTICILNPNKTF